MRKTFIILLIPALLFAQEFEWFQELDSIRVEVEGYEVPVPWIGGYSRTAPEFADIDADGDKDIFLGIQRGDIAHYLNVGSCTNPEWNYITGQFEGISLLVYMGQADPVFVDIDNDGDLDLFSSCARGLVHYWENQGSALIPNFVLINDSLEYIDVPGVAHLDFPDIDDDDDFDLIIGDNTGVLWYYQNIGTSESFDFEFVTSNMSSIDVGDAASPCFIDLDNDNDLDLTIGNSEGEIWYYCNEGSSQQYEFTLISSNWLGANVGENACPDFCDIDFDGDYDFFIGKENDYSYNVPGDLHFWRNTGSPDNYNFIHENEMYLTVDFGIVSEPGLLDINLDSKGDPFVLSYYFGWLKNIGTVSEPQYSHQNYNTTGLGFLASTFGYGDLNGDNSDDLVIVEGWTGEVQFWLNNGDTLNPEFYYESFFDAGEMAGEPCLADMDGDGDQDLILGVGTYNFDYFLHYYENQGTPQQYYFVLTTINYQGWAGVYAVTNVLDFDGDNDNDIISAGPPNFNTMTYFENLGTPQNAIFGNPYPNFIIPDSSDIMSCDFNDVDGDGDMDVFFGSIYGGIRFFRNVTGQNEVGPKRPDTPFPRLDFSIGPNPANPVTWISFTLPSPQEATLAVYNILGAKVTTLTSGIQPPGIHSFIWNAAEYSSGVYIIQLETPQLTSVERVTVVK
ncbi:hypothetical protein CEE37_04850 [candidate division LCP-89 bacterium B3_LCP]|uniref:Secretion system C-terminal sorting domain-containing protein n=1 Tax=candidate division LCP-89 bacterium B3_LCP TaxID=2012998 RepID=A0A532V1A2_UNCL8|nr:MAG: hypothetical protein CEE37_04850 [candidate division LCP-89 bacterium B3_LCP]